MSAMLRPSMQPVLKTLTIPSTISCRNSWFDRFKDNVRFAKDLDHATGEERLVKLAIAKGIKDPYDVHPQVRGPGTKDNPNLVQCFQDRRMVGCKCEEDSTSIKYLWVYLGESKRCECGYYFKGIPARKFWEEVGP